MGPSGSAPGTQLMDVGSLDLFIPEEHRLTTHPKANKSDARNYPSFQGARRKYNRKILLLLMPFAVCAGATVITHWIGGTR